MNAFSSLALRATPFLLIPLLVLLLVRNDLNQAGGLDAFVYAAYIHDYADLVARYGRTYYSTRLAHILPNATAAFLFGDHAGYYLNRYILIVATTVSIYMIARRYSKPPAAWFVTLFFSTHVWLLHQIFWDHYDASVVVFALVGLALLLPRANETLAHIGAGFAIAWAANGNPMGLVIAALYAPTWLIDRRKLPWPKTLKSVTAACVGFVLGYGVLILAMKLLYPDGGWRFEEVTLAMLGYLLTGGGTNWYVSLSTIFLDRSMYESLIFPFFLGVTACGLLASLRGSAADRWNAVGAASFVVLTATFFAVLHFILRWGVLALHYYLIYALPAAILATSALIGQFRPQGSHRSIVIAAVAFLVVHWAFWFNAHRLFPSLTERSPYLLPIALSMMAIAFLSLGWLAATTAKQMQKLTPAILFLIALLSSNAFFLQYGFARIFGNDDRRQLEWDIRDGSLYLQRFVAARVPTTAAIRFWYGNRDVYLNSVQSAHLWGFSRLSSPTQSEAQMPSLDDGVRTRLASARYIAILGSDFEIETALRALQGDGIRMDVVARGSFKGRSWPGYDILLLAIQPG
ncbi:MAG: hypothetical protein ACT4O6_06355 [Reyranella sp.]